MTYLGLWDAIFLILALPMYVGWLYLPYRHIADGISVDPFWTPGKIAAILVTVSIYGLILFHDWNPSFEQWLHRRIALFGYNPVAWRLWPLLGVPLWALTVALFPHILKRMFAPKPLFIEPFPDSL